MNKHLILIAIVFQFVASTLKAAGLIGEGEQWNLWYMGLGMGVLILADALVLAFRKHRKPTAE